MSFSKFRESGDLSDISVFVEDKEFKLHRFPLYAKSEFFCTLARNTNGDMKRVELSDFPGGREAFSLIADFCYNMDIEITKHNVVQVKCAAEFLKMVGPDNLSEMSDKALHDILRSAQLSRSPLTIVKLLLHSCKVGALAKNVGIVTSCAEALVDCWMRPPTKFTSPSISTRRESEGQEDKCTSLLVNLPLDWFVIILNFANDKGVSMDLLAELALRYISDSLESDDSEDVSNTDSKLEMTNVAKEYDNQATYDLDLLREANPKVVNTTGTTDIGTVLDAVVLQLPEDALLSDVFTIEWITSVLSVARSRGCKCTPILAKVACEFLQDLDASELIAVSSSVLQDIIVESCKSPNAQNDAACKLVQRYMDDLAKAGELTSETFKTLAGTIPPEKRQYGDKMFHILESILYSERSTLLPSQRDELLATVDFSLLHEDTLKRALEIELVPPVDVAKAALVLCTKLRSELDSMKVIARVHEEEIQKMNQLQDTSPAKAEHSSSPYLRTGSNIASRPVGDIKENNSRTVDLTTQELLSAARNKLANNSSTYPYKTNITNDHDANFDQELDFRYDRSFRSLDSRVKPRISAPNSSYRYPYSHRI